MAKDPYQYFRIEAREHLEGLLSGFLELEKSGDNHEVVDRLLRHAHTLKGAARVVRQPRIAELSHSIEEGLAAVRAAKGTPSKEQINQLLRLTDGIDDHLKSLDVPAEAAVARSTEGTTTATASEQTPALDTVRLAVSELDPLLNGIWEVGINLRTMRQQADVLIDNAVESAGTRITAKSRPSDIVVGRRAESSSIAAYGPAISNEVESSLRQLQRTLLALIGKTERELAELQDRTEHLRLLPARSLFPALERAARDTADALGREIQFTAEDGENRVDAHVLRGLSGALLHLVRNAVSHGVESPEARTAAGKPPAGRVDVAVERRGNCISFVCRDDGRGVDVEQVARAAATQGLLPAGPQTLSPEQAIGFIFRSGISTAAVLTEHSGRGIGLDAVRETVSRLRGSVEMQSTPSAGTTVRINVPVSLESMSALEIEVAGVRSCIPFDAVRRVVHIADAQIARTARGDSVIYEGVPLALIPLQGLLFPEKELRAAPELKRTVVIIESGGGTAAIEVDRVGGRITVALKPLPEPIAEMDLVLGACLDAAGHPQVVLDAARLADVTWHVPGVAPRSTPKPKSCVLVIDDSLTTRMLEQSILESAGYDVDLAISGEDALTKAKNKRYAIFIVDVEMPGMNGFEFIAKVKSDPNLQRIPAILVTSRGSPEDRARGEAAGASAHILKNEFGEAEFLRTIRRLLG